MSTEKEMFKAIRDVLLAGFAARTPPVVLGVKQAEQPVQQGTPTGPTIFMTLVDQHRYGTPQRTDEWDEQAEVMRHTESQWYESHFQLNALSTQNPKDAAQLTAGDLLNYAAYILQSDAGRQALREDGLGIERVTDVRNPKFQDDRDRFEASPSFDFVLTHKQIVVSEVPVLQSTELRITRV